MKKSICRHWIICPYEWRQNDKFYGPCRHRSPHKEYYMCDDTKRKGSAGTHEECRYNCVEVEVEENDMPEMAPMSP